MLFAGHEKDRLDAGAHPAIQQGHLKLGLIVRNGANATQNNTGLTMRRIINQQSLKRIHFHVSKRSGRLLEHFDSFRNWKKRLFLSIFENRYDELTDQK